MKFEEAQTVCISVNALYDNYHHLMLGRIEVTDDNYYDLYNEDGELACMDGEEVTIAQVGNNLITFRNDNDESSIYFALTREEAEIAIIPRVV